MDTNLLFRSIPVDVASEEHDGIEERLTVLQNVLDGVERVAVVHLEVTDVADLLRTNARN